MSTRPMHSSPEVFQKLQNLYFEGQQLANEGKFEQAADKYTEGIQIDDHFRHQYVTQYAMRAWCYMHIKKFSEAIPDLEKAIEMEPDFYHADYYLKLGRCYEQGTEDKEKALKSYTNSINLNSEAPGPYYYRGLMYYDAEEYTLALPDIEKVIALSPKIDKGIYDIRDYIRTTLGMEPANDDDPEIFPGQSISKLSDYVGFMKKLQQGDMNGALADYNLDMMQYATVAQQWAGKIANDHELAAKFGQLIAK